MHTTQKCLDMRRLLFFMLLLVCMEQSFICLCTVLWYGWSMSFMWYSSLQYHCFWHRLKCVKIKHFLWHLTAKNKIPQIMWSDQEETRQTKQDIDDHIVHPVVYKSLDIYFWCPNGQMCDSSCLVLLLLLWID